MLDSRERLPYYRHMNMTKRQVKQALGYTMDKELVQFFGVTKQAVSLWADDKPIPQARQWQAMALRPDLFRPKAS